MKRCVIFLANKQYAQRTRMCEDMLYGLIGSHAFLLHAFLAEVALVLMRSQQKSYHLTFFHHRGNSVLAMASEHTAQQL
ncbi:MAG: hypothetical protein HFE75_04005 [Firmicutes bacterium]|nr:hypothetical protein [Bacillota bacterium]